MNSAIQQCILVLRCEGTASYQYTEAVAEKYRPIEGERIIERWILNTWKSPQIEFLGCQKRVRCPNLQLGCDSQSGLIQKRIQRTNCELPNMAVTDHNDCLSSKYLKLSTKFICALQPLPAFCRHKLNKLLSELSDNLFRRLRHNLSLWLSFADSYHLPLEVAPTKWVVIFPDKLFQDGRSSRSRGE